MGKSKDKIEIDFSIFMDQLDIIGRRFIIDQNITPEKLEEICSECGKKFYTFWDYDKCPDCRKIDMMIREDKGNA